MRYRRVKQLGTRNYFEDSLQAAFYRGRAMHLHVSQSGGADGEHRLPPAGAVAFIAALSALCWAAVIAAAAALL